MDLRLLQKLYKPQLDLQMSLLAHIAPLKGHHRKMMDIVECMHEVTFHRGHTVVAEEALVSDMFVVKQGKLKVSCRSRSVRSVAARKY